VGRGVVSGTRLNYQQHTRETYSPQNGLFEISVQFREKEATMPNLTEEEKRQEELRKAEEERKRQEEERKRQQEQPKPNR
jgi:hypothetical protein